MTQQEKQLLLRDLSARLPYGVMYETPYGPRVLNDIFIYSNGPVYTDHGVGNYNEVFGIELENIKPYLRPMSSMTEEEREEFDKVLKSCNDKVFACPDKERRYNFFDAEQEDFMNAHHFDYRGLIEKSLAIIAPEGMYKTE